MIVFFTCLKRLAVNPLVWLFILIFPLVIYFAITATVGHENTASRTAPVKIGLTDLDDSLLSQVLTGRLKERYICSDIPEGDAAAYLSEQNVSWVLTIPKGYQSNLLDGRVPHLAGTSIALSDAQFIASASAESTTRALLVLAAGADEAALPRLISEWKAVSEVEVKAVPAPVSWEQVGSWVNFYAWVAMLTTFFAVRTIMVDRKGGLPERVGVLPMSRQRFLAQCVLAALVPGEVSAALLMLGAQTAMDGSPLPNPWHMFLLLSVYNLFASGFSIALFSILKREANISFAVVISSTLLAMLGGSYWPIEFMPAPMQTAARAVPNYWLNLGLRGIENITAEDYWLSVSLLACFAVGVFLLGSWRKPPKEEE